MFKLRIYRRKSWEKKNVVTLIILVTKTVAHVELKSFLEYESVHIFFQCQNWIQHYCHISTKTSWQTVRWRNVFRHLIMISDVIFYISYLSKHDDTATILVHGTETLQMIIFHVIAYLFFNQQKEKSDKFEKRNVCHVSWLHRITSCIFCVWNNDV